MIKTFLTTFSTFVIIFLFWNVSFSRELVSIDQVSGLGLQIRMGELTGAGSKISLHKLAGLVLPEGILMKENFKEILIKNTKDPMISDIVKITNEGEELSASDFIGFVIH